MVETVPMVTGKKHKLSALTASSMVEEFFPRPPIPVLNRLFKRARDDSWIAFGSRRPTKKGGRDPHYLYTVKKGELKQWLPPILQHEMGVNTQYLAQNTMGISALRKYSHRNAPARAPEDYSKAIEDGKPIYYQAWDAHVRELSGIVLDLDCYKPPANLSPEITLGLVLDMVRQKGTLPQPSIAALSGRGVYLWYLLSDNDGFAPLNTVENRHQWTLILDELCRRTRGLQSDPRARRLLQWVKSPGTIDTLVEDQKETKSGNIVLYMTFGAGPLATVPEYQLGELVDELGLMLAPATTNPAPQLIAPQVAGAPPTWRPGKAGNPYASHQARVRELEKLASDRGGIHEGHRHHTLVCFYRCRLASYGGAGKGPAVVALAKEETRRFARLCVPPLLAEQVAAVFGSWKCTYKPRRETLVAQLDITDDESRALGLQALATTAVKNEREQAQANKFVERANLEAEIAKLLLPPHNLSKRAIEKATGASYSRISRCRAALVKAGQLDQAPDVDQGQLPM